MRFLLPQGIGDSVWALLKIQDAAKKLGDGVVDVVLNTLNVDIRENRAVNFIKRFSFVNSVGQIQTPITKDVYPPLDMDGYYIYLDDGWNEKLGAYVFIPNRTLERGQRIETWHPEFSINWDIMKDFRFDENEKEFAKSLGQEYAVFYLGPKSGNTVDGHNRNGIWSPDDWAYVARFCNYELNLPVVIVGASYDRDYWTEFVRPKMLEQHYIDLVGKLPISATFAVTKRARFIVSFQSGIGIVSEYMGVPTAIFWRQKGDSISPHPGFYTSFEEGMNGAWSNPEHLAKGNHMALYYGRHDAVYVCNEIRKRGW